MKASCLCITVFFLKLLIAPLWLVQFCNCYVILYQGCILFIRIYLFFNVFWNCKCYPVVGASWCMFLTFPLGSDVSGPAAWEVNESMESEPPVRHLFSFPLLGLRPRRLTLVIKVSCSVIFYISQLEFVSLDLHIFSQDSLNIFPFYNHALYRMILYKFYSALKN